MYLIHESFFFIFQFSNLIPDFIVTGPDFGLKGPGGLLCIGFWGNDWEYRRDLSSCVC